jgi:hypothetical protein
MMNPEKITLLFFFQIKLISLLFAKEGFQTKQGLGLPQTYSVIAHAQKIPGP